MTKPNRLPNETDPLCQCGCDEHFVPVIKSRPQKYKDNEHKGRAMMTQVTVACIGPDCSKTKTMVPSHVPEGGWRCLDCYNLAQTSDELERWESYAHGVGVEPAHVPGIGPCTLFTGTPTKDGYGAFQLSGESHKQVQAHIYAWILANGPIPDRLCVCHHCDTRACIRIDHLFLDTRAGNNADRHRKGREAKGAMSGPTLHPWSMARGEQQGLHVLTELQVREIRRLRKDGVSIGELARRFGVVKGTIYQVVQWITWRHVAD